MQRIASIMRAVRLQTGMEGKQLGAYSRLSWDKVSQDDVTQTLLFRAAQQATGAMESFRGLAAMDDLSRGRRG